MANVATYLGFDGNAEEVFTFYKSVFGTEFDEPGIVRMGDMFPPEGENTLPDEMKNFVGPVSLPTLGSHQVMGSDMPVLEGGADNGKTNYILLQPDATEDADALYAKMSDGGNAESPLQDAGFGYFGTLVDKFGVRWMFNVSNQQ